MRWIFSKKSNVLLLNATPKWMQALGPEIQRSLLYKDWNKGSPKRPNQGGTKKAVGFLGLNY